MCCICCVCSFYTNMPSASGGIRDRDSSTFISFTFELRCCEILYCVMFLKSLRGLFSYFSMSKSMSISFNSFARVLSLPGSMSQPTATPPHLPVWKIGLWNRVMAAASVLLLLLSPLFDFTSEAWSKDDERSCFRRHSFIIRLCQMMSSTMTITPIIPAMQQVIGMAKRGTEKKNLLSFRAVQRAYEIYILKTWFDHVINNM